MSSDWAEAPSIASDLLREELPRRHAHVLGVGQRGVDALAHALDDETTRLLEAAGLLHDIGYSAQLQDTGFHPIDGARYLRSIDYDRRVVNLVANHTCAHVEAKLRQLDQILVAEFPKDPALPHDELCFCDLTTSPSGELITVDDRLSDIRSRYGPGSIVYDFVELAEDELRSACQRVEERARLSR